MTNLTIRRLFVVGAVGTLLLGALGCDSTEELDDQNDGAEDSPTEGTAESDDDEGDSSEGEDLFALVDESNSNSANSNQPDDTTDSSNCSAAGSVQSVVANRDDETGIGELNVTNICVPELGFIETISLKYELDSFFGEPTRQAVFAYEGDFSISDVLWVARVVNNIGSPVLSGSEEVWVSWSEGTFRDSGEGFGIDSTGSPNWTETFGTWDGISEEGDQSDDDLFEFLLEDDAKNIYRAGFSLDSLTILSINGKLASAP